MGIQKFDNNNDPVAQTEPVGTPSQQTADKLGNIVNPSNEDGNLLSIKTNTDNLDVLLSTRSTEVTLATRASELTLSGIKSQTDLLTFASTRLVVDGSGVVQTVSLFDGQHNKQTQYSAFGLLKTVTESMVGDYRFIDATTTDADWTTTFTGIGSRSFVGTGIKLNTGASTASKAQMDTINTHMYQSGRGQMTKMSVILGDTGVAGNIREWGYGNDTDGYFFRMDGTTLQAVVKRSGSEIVIDSSNWDIPVTPDSNGHLYYIQFEWLGVGDIYFYYDEQIVHTYKFIGTDTEFSVNNPDLPIRLLNENTTNATDVALRLGCVAVVTEGGTVISGIDGTGQLHQASVTPEGRLEVNATIVPSVTNPVTTIHEAVVKDDAFLVKLLSFNLGSSGVEGPVMLIRNPGGSGSTLYIHTLGTNNEVKTQTAKINIYKLPVVTVTGTVETIENQLVGSATASVMSAFSTPTVSSNGSLLYSFATGANQNDLRRNFFFGAALPAGFDYLITGIGSNNNTLIDVSFEWAEV